MLLGKPVERTALVAAHFTAFECPDDIVVGYALDLAHRFHERRSWVVWRERQSRGLGFAAKAADPRLAIELHSGPLVCCGCRGGEHMARILLADDDASTRDLVQRALATDGHNVSPTQDGSEALEKLREAPGSFDLLITDVQMPGLDGIALAEASVGIDAKLRVILMSGFAGELGRADHLKGRISRIITKPFTLEQIRAAAKAALA